MPIAIPNTASTDAFVSFGGGLYTGGWIQVFDQTGTTGGGGIDVYVTHKPGGGQSAIEQGAIIQFSPGLYPLIGTPTDPVVTVNVRSHVAGKPAQFLGLLIEEGKSGFGSGAQIVGSLSAAGSVTQPVSGTIQLTGRVKGIDGTIFAGTGFSVVRSGVGVYAVTFTTALTAVPLVLLTLTQSGAQSGTVNSVATTGFSVSAFNTTTGAALDVDFNFAVLVVS